MKLNLLQFEKSLRRSEERMQAVTKQPNCITNVWSGFREGGRGGGADFRNESVRLKAKEIGHKLCAAVDRLTSHTSTGTQL